jgi:hypothetical protein
VSAASGGVVGGPAVILSVGTDGETTAVTTVAGAANDESGVHDGVAVKIALVGVASPRCVAVSRGVTVGRSGDGVAVGFGVDVDLGVRVGFGVLEGVVRAAGVSFARSGVLGVSGVGFSVFKERKSDRT